MSHLLLHTPLAGFALAILAGAIIGLRMGASWKDKLMLAALLGTMSPIWLEAARLAIKGAL